MGYTSRLVDATLDELMAGLPAVALDGAKGVGKTATATRRADTVLSADLPATRLRLENDPTLATVGSGTTFIDEWQLVPDLWNVVRRAVDDGAPPGRFLLAGSATAPPTARLHSGAGRIVRLLMRPLCLPERGLATPTVSLAGLLSDVRPDIAGAADLSTLDYVREILASGFPGIRPRPQAAREHLLASYLDQIVEHDIPEFGGTVRRPVALRGWLAAYGAATGTATSYASILRAATPGEETKPARDTAMAYRDLLQRLWILDPLPAWLPGGTHLTRLMQGPKHHLVDPALAATLVGATETSLIRGDGPARRDETFLGSLFESLAVQTVRVLADRCRARTYHLRTQGGDHEVDIIVERPDRRVVAFEVKTSTAVRPHDVIHLTWLKQQAPGQVLDCVVLNMGDTAYRRKDGIAVVPLALLGP